MRLGFLLPPGMKDMLTKVGPFIAWKKHLAYVGVNRAVCRFWFMFKALQECIQYPFLKAVTGKCLDDLLSCCG